MLAGTAVSIVQAFRETQAEYISEQRVNSEQEARIAEVEVRTDAEQAKNLAQQNASSTDRQQYRAEMQLGPSAAVLPAEGHIVLFAASLNCSLCCVR